MDRPDLVRLGTRATPLALAQAHEVRRALEAQHLSCELVEFSSQGDRSLGGSLSQAKGMFTAELETALLEHRIDAAVHSLKDLPVEMDSAFAISAIPSRAPANDLLIWPAASGIEGGTQLTDLLGQRTLAEEQVAEGPAEGALHRLKQGAAVGTSSPRRQAQTLHLRPDLLCVAVRGAVGTRLRKLLSTDVEALLLAEAGLLRMLHDSEHRDLFGRLHALRLSVDSWPSAPGQGALGIQTLAGAPASTLAALHTLHCPESARQVTWERNALSALGGGCQKPFGATVSAHGGASCILASDSWRRDAAAGAAPTLHSLQASVDAPAERIAETLRGAVSQRERHAGASTAHEATSAVDLWITGDASARRRLARDLPQNWTIRGASLLQREVIESGSLPVRAEDLRRPRRAWPWVLVSSPTCASVLVEQTESEPLLGQLPWCALGEGTARALIGLSVPPNLVARAVDGADFADFVMARLPAECHLLVPLSERSPGGLVRKLQKAERRVTSWHGYRTLHRPENLWPEEAPTPRRLLLTSPSQAEAAFSSGRQLPPILWAIGRPTGERTEQLLQQAGESRTLLVSASPTAEGLAQLAHREP